MASERARKFAAGLVTVGANAHGWDIRSFGIVGYPDCGYESREQAEEAATQYRNAIATALDRYEAEAWTAITDDPGSWPPEGEAVLSLLADGKMRVWAIRVDDCGCCAWWGSNGRPTHWRPLPAPPKETGK